MVVGGGGEDEEEGEGSVRCRQVWSGGWSLFWHVVQQACHDTYYYPPARQLTASTAHMLGQVGVGGGGLGLI